MNCIAPVQSEESNSFNDRDLKFKVEQDLLNMSRIPSVPPSLFEAICVVGQEVLFHTLGNSKVLC